MGSILYQYVRLMFGAKTTTKVTEIITIVLDALEGFFVENGTAHAVLQILMGVGASLLIVFLFMDMLDKASKDLFTLEKLVLTFIRFLITFAILLFLPNLLIKGFEFSRGLYEMVSEKTDTFSANSDEEASIIFFKGSPKAPAGFRGVPDDKDSRVQADGNDQGWSFVQVLAHKGKENVEPEVQKESKLTEAEEKKVEAYGITPNKNVDSGPSACYYAGFTGITKAFGVFLICVVGWIAGFITELVTMFAVVSNALQLLVRTLFAPIAVVQCFDEGQRSSGIRFLKKFFATGLTFAVIIGVLYMMQNFTAALMSNALEIKEGVTEFNVSIKDFRNFMETPSKQIIILISRFASVGMILGASKLADEIFGVH